MTESISERTENMPAINKSISERTERPVRILGIDSSGLVAGVAVTEDDVLVAEYTTNYKKTHSQTLLPMLDELRRMVELDLNTLDAIAVASGPGSFTGLRIGAATAKGLGLALNRPLVEVPTLEGLAWNVWGAGGIVCPLMDARRNQVYTAAYRYTAGEEGYRLQEAAVPRAVEIGEWIECLNGLGERLTFVGDGVPVYAGLIRQCCRVPYVFAPAGVNRQRAASVASLGTLYFREGRTVTAAEHRPEYLRKSQAEREAAAGGV